MIGNEPFAYMNRLQEYYDYIQKPIFSAFFIIVNIYQSYLTYKVTIGDGYELFY